MRQRQEIQKMLWGCRRSSLTAAVHLFLCVGRRATLGLRRRGWEAMQRVQVEPPSRETRVRQDGTVGHGQKPSRARRPNSLCHFRWLRLLHFTVSCNSKLRWARVGGGGVDAGRSASCGLFNVAPNIYPFPALRCCPPRAGWSIRTAVCGFRLMEVIRLFRELPLHAQVETACAVFRPGLLERRVDSILGNDQISKSCKRNVRCAHLDFSAG